MRMCPAFGNKTGFRLALAACNMLNQGGRHCSCALLFTAFCPGALRASSYFAALLRSNASCHNANHGTSQQHCLHCTIMLSCLAIMVIQLN